MSAADIDAPFLSVEDSLRAQNAALRSELERTRVDCVTVATHCGNLIAELAIAREKITKLERAIDLYEKIARGR